MIQRRLLPPERSRGLLLLVATAIIIGVFGPVAVCAGQAGVGNTARQVMNSDTPSGGIHSLHLEELWRVGGENEDILFGQVIRAVVDDAGNIYLLDAQLCHVEVFDPQGEHLRTLSREGEGPGEIRQPADMIFLPDDTFGILTRFPGRLTKLDRNGNPAGTIMFRARDATEGGFTATHYSAAAGDNLIIVGNEIRQAELSRERTWFVARYDLEGNELVRFHSFSYLPDGPRPALIERHIIASFLFTCAPGLDGRVFVAPSRNEYQVRVYAPDGVLELVIERDFDNRRREPIEIQRVRDILEVWASRREGEVTMVVEELAASVMGVRVTGSGELWVDNSRSGFEQPKGVFKTYDVFDREGRFTRQAVVHCAGDPLDDQLFFLRDDLAVMIKDYHPTFYALMGRVAVEGDEEQAANMEMVVYRVPR